MNDHEKLERIRELAHAKIMELRPLAGEEMNLRHDDARWEGFIEGERTLAAQVLALLEGEDAVREELAESP